MPALLWHLALIVKLRLGTVLAPTLLPDRGKLWRAVRVAWSCSSLLKGKHVLRDPAHCSIVQAVSGSVDRLFAIRQEACWL